MLCEIGNKLETVVIFDECTQSIEIITTPEDDMSQYTSKPGIVTVADNQSGSAPIYLGYCVSQPNSSLNALEALPIWQIAMIAYDISGNFINETWAVAGANELIWNNRTSYIYS